MNQNQIDRIALAIHALRPDWRADSLRTFIANQITKAGLPLAQMPYRDLATAFVWIATDDDTRLPTRILEHGPWWEATQPNTATTGPKTYSPPPIRSRDICHACTRDQTGHDAINRLDPDSAHPWLTLDEAKRRTRTHQDNT